MVASTSRNRINDVVDVACSPPAKAATTPCRRRASATSPFKTTQRQYLWQNDFTLPLGALGVILERREEHLPTDADFAITQRNTNSATGVYQLRYDAFALQANLRRDDSSQYGGKTTGGIALGYKLSPAWRLTAGYSTGFKAPSFNDLYYPDFSNPDLVPETSQQRRGRRVLERVVQATCAGKRAPSAIHNQVSELIVFAVRRRLQLPAAKRRPRHARGRDAGARPHLARHAA